MSFVVLVGHSEMSRSSQHKSSSALWTPLFSATLVLILLVCACYILTEQVICTREGNIHQAELELTKHLIHPRHTHGDIRPVRKPAWQLASRYPNLIEVSLQTLEHVFQDRSLQHNNQQTDAHHLVPDNAGMFPVLGLVNVR